MMLPPEERSDPDLIKDAQKVCEKFRWVMYNRLKFKDYNSSCVISKRKIRRLFKAKDLLDDAQIEELNKIRRGCPSPSGAMLELSYHAFQDLANKFNSLLIERLWGHEEELGSS